ncbi:MAG: ATP-binding cassette domain-containing protein [Eubacteriales bacterium]|nr:ATP-binding cassette domain-containing protein [Eubacteriales bacterium]
MIELIKLSKTYKTDKSEFEALKDISLTIADGDIYGIIGMSGAGKSTLVRCINLLEVPSSGEIRIDGKNIQHLNGAELRSLRRSVSMIFQGFNLLMQRNCLANVRFPLELEGMPKRQANKRALELLELVGLSDKAKEYPSRLSGGQQQRVAIARALATDPKVLLCDEATSALDPKTTSDILSLIRDIHDKLGISVIVITHQMSVIETICTKVAVLDNGVVVEEGRVDEVFSSPRSAAAKTLVYPEGYLEYTNTQIADRCIRVVFNGADAAAKPLIARMAIDQSIEASIIFASTKSISGRIYGSMLLGVSSEDNIAERTIQYLCKTDDILAEEVINVD